MSDTTRNPRPSGRGGSQERIDNVDHWVPVHAPDQLNRLLLEFLGA
ncbi:MAG: hypothetical protein ACJ782_08610 [Actinomycetota bacterium]